MAVVGDQFDDCGPSVNGTGSTSPAAGADAGSWRSANGADNVGSGNGGGVTSGESEICGCTLSVRQNEDILSIWNRHGYDPKVKQKIKCVSLHSNLPMLFMSSVQRHHCNCAGATPNRRFRIQDE